MRLSGIRRKCNSGANPTTAHFLGQIICVVARARRASERILLLVREAPMAELFLLACLGTKASIAYEHPESLVPLINYVVMSYGGLILTLGKAVTLLLPSYGGM